MDAAIARYPHEHRRSAAMPLLHLWQEHFGFISDDAVTWVAAKLGLQPINILELVTFYPMFRQEPAGKTHIRVCRTLSCAMAGGSQLMENLCAATGIKRERQSEGMSALRTDSSCGEHNPISVSPDGNYSVEFVECLASCGTAPVCMVNEELHENLNPDSVTELIADLKEGRSPVRPWLSGGVETAAPCKVRRALALPPGFNSPGRARS